MKETSIAVARAFCMRPLGPILAVVAILALAASRGAAQQAGATAPLSAGEANAIATDAYIFGYPLVTMEYTRRALTNVATPAGTRAPMGQLVRMRSYPDASFHDVTAPNADTLYTTGWIDVGKEPYVLSIPN